MLKQTEATKCLSRQDGYIGYHTAGYCCEVQIFAKLLKWYLAEISAIAKFARHGADLHWILCQENAWAKFTHLQI